MARVGVVACRVHDRLVVCPRRSLALEAGVGPYLASGGVGLDSSWEVVVQWPGRPCGRPERLDAREDRQGSRERNDAWLRLEVATTLRGRRVRPRVESPGLCQPSSWTRLELAAAARPHHVV